MKKCFNCGVEKPLTEFHKAGPNRHNIRCKPCRKEFRKKERATTFAYSIRTRFNLTPERYEEILAAQGGCCAVCKTTEPTENTYWQIDHDHRCCPGRNSCGECIRGILCSNCNLALGILEKYGTLKFDFTEYVNQRV